MQCDVLKSLDSLKDGGNGDTLSKEDVELFIEYLKKGSKEVIRGNNGREYKTALDWRRYAMDSVITGFDCMNDSEKDLLLDNLFNEVEKIKKLNFTNPTQIERGNIAIMYLITSILYKKAQIDSNNKNKYLGQDGENLFKKLTKTKNGYNFINPWPEHVISIFNSIKKGQIIKETISNVEISKKDIDTSGRTTTLRNVENGKKYTIGTLPSDYSGTLTDPFSKSGNDIIYIHNTQQSSGNVTLTLLEDSNYNRKTITINIIQDSNESNQTFIEKKLELKKLGEEISYEASGKNIRNIKLGTINLSTGRNKVKMQNEETWIINITDNQNGTISAEELLESKKRNINDQNTTITGTINGKRIKAVGSFIIKQGNKNDLTVGDFDEKSLNVTFEYDDYNNTQTGIKIINGNINSSEYEYSASISNGKLTINLEKKVEISAKEEEVNQAIDNLNLENVFKQISSNHTVISLPKYCKDNLGKNYYNVSYEKELTRPDGIILNNNQITIDYSKIEDSQTIKIKAIIKSGNVEKSKIFTITITKEKKENKSITDYFYKSNDWEEIKNRCEQENKIWSGIRNDLANTRTGKGRLRDSEEFIAKNIKDKAFIIDIGSALGNPNPALAGVTVFELCNNASIKKANPTIIATEIQGYNFGMQKWQEHLEKREISNVPFKVELIGAEGDDNQWEKTDIVGMVKKYGGDENNQIIIRAANSIDMLAEEHELESHLIHIATSLQNYEVIYLFNKFILYKKKGEFKFSIIGDLNLSGFDHKSSDGLDWEKNFPRIPYTIRNPYQKDRTQSEYIYK